MKSTHLATYLAASLSLVLLATLFPPHFAVEEAVAPEAKIPLESSQTLKVGAVQAQAVQRDSYTVEYLKPEAPAAAPLLTYSGGGSPAEWMAAAGIAESDWGYVDFVVNKESGWNPNAVNASSGASGLVQALPCGKVPGNCFDPVDNLRWANGYATDRYGSWAGAHEFWVTNNWW